MIAFTQSEHVFHSSAAQKVLLVEADGRTGKKKKKKK